MGADRLGEHAEHNLIRRCQRGEWQVFDRLLEPHRHRVYRLAYRLTGSHADADDVLQDALLRAFRGLASFDGRAAFGTWLWRIVTTAAIDHNRRQGRHRTAQGLEGAPAYRPDSVSNDPVERAAARELDQTLNRALGALQADQRSALVLVALEGLTYADAARVLECPVGTLAWRVAEARRKLNDELADCLAAS
jgi:RNA polymerase sigma-70 factor, ECF subfamily